MQIEGVVKWIGEVVEKSNAVYRSLDFVVETEEEYPQRAVINIFGKAHETYGFKADQFLREVAIGDKLDIQFNSRSTEYNGRHYNNLSLWSYKKISSAPVAQASAPQPAPAPIVKEEESDLPF